MNTIFYHIVDGTTNEPGIFMVIQQPVQKTSQMLLLRYMRLVTIY